MKVIILSITAYKEKDGIVSAISEDESLSFLVRGLFDPKSKGNYLNTPLTIADIVLQSGKSKYPALKDSVLVSSPLRKQSTYEDMIALQLVIEASNKLMIDEEKHLLYPYLIDFIEAYKNYEDINSLMLIYLANILKLSGYEFEINHCLFCGSKKNIVSFSFSDGGFVCSDCMNETTPRDLTNEQMMILRNVFSKKSFEKIEGLNEINTKVLLSKFNEFIYDSYGVRLKAIELFNK